MGKDVEYIIDDRCIIPDEIKQMTSEERQREIRRLEEEGRKERDRLRRERTKQLA